MRNEWCIVLLVGATLCALPARAGSTADDLAQIEAQHAVLKARLRVLETRAQMAARQADIDRHVSSRSTLRPSVASIEGVSGKFRATLRMGDEHAMEVVAGDTLANGMRVVSITADAVVLQASNRRKLRLSPTGDLGERAPSVTLASHAPASPAGDRLPAVPSMPPRSEATR